MQPSQEDREGGAVKRATQTEEHTQRESARATGRERQREAERGRERESKQDTCQWRVTKAFSLHNE
jgi:hypothetical protein